jgi:hypothetical protein
MNATELLAELRPPLEPTADEAVLERILLVGPEPPRRRRRRLHRPLALAIAAVAAVMLFPSGPGGPVGLARAVAALSEPGVLLHFKVTTTHQPSGDSESGETWQTPDGRRTRVIRGADMEWAYDQRARVDEVYLPERNAVLVHTTPALFEDVPDPFGSVETLMGASPTFIGDLPALLQRALDGGDPNVRHVGVTTIAGAEVDQVRVERSSAEATLIRDVYVRHDNALPVRVVDQLEERGKPRRVTSVSEFSDVQLLPLDGGTEHLLRLADRPGAKRIVMPPSDG